MRGRTRDRSLALCLIAGLAAGCAATRPSGGEPPDGPRVAVPEEPTRTERAADPEGAEPEDAEPMAADRAAGGTGDAAGTEPERSLPAGAPLPETVAGRTFGEWLEVYNHGDESEVEGFIGTRFSPEFLAQLPVPALVAFHLQSRESTGELAPVEIQPEGEHGLRALAGAAGGGGVMITLAVEPEPPHRITGLRMVTPGS